MAVSGLMGATFFLIANFTTILHGLNLAAGCIQLAINAFVFCSWRRGFTESKGFARFVTFVGTIVPIIMASITLIRVILPALFT